MTVIGLLTRVSTQVALQRAGNAELLVAAVASVRPLPRMLPHVNRQEGLLYEALVATITRVGPIFRVDTENVHFEHVAISETLVTNGAHIFALFVVVVVVVRRACVTGVRFEVCFLFYRDFL